MKLDFRRIGYSGFQRGSCVKGDYKYYFYRYKLEKPIEKPDQYSNILRTGKTICEYAPEIQGYFVDIWDRKVRINKTTEVANDDREFNFTSKIKFKDYIPDREDANRFCIPCNNDCCVGCKYQGAPDDYDYHDDDDDDDYDDDYRQML